MGKVLLVVMAGAATVPAPGLLCMDRAKASSAESLTCCAPATRFGSNPLISG